MAGNLLDVLRIGGDSVLVITTGVSAQLAIPPLEDASLPKFVWVRAEYETGDEVIAIRPGWDGDLGPPVLPDTVVTLANGMHIPSHGHPVLLNITGYTHIAHISSGTTPTLYVTPLDNS